MRVVGILIAWSSCACKSQWTASVEQPPLVLSADRQARTSLPLAIVVKDMELPRRLRLANVAHYVVVSRDRLRFHVTLHHKWDDVASIENWGVWLEDQNGDVYAPEHVDQRRVRALPLGRKPVYRGVADLTFYRRDLFATSNTLTLVLVRPGYEYRYTWISRAVADGQPPIGSFRNGSSASTVDSSRLTDSSR